MLRRICPFPGLPAVQLILERVESVYSRSEDDEKVKTYETPDQHAPEQTRILQLREDQVEGSFRSAGIAGRRDDGDGGIDEDGLGQDMKP